MSGLQFQTTRLSQKLLQLFLPLTATSLQPGRICTTTKRQSISCELDLWSRKPWINNTVSKTLLMLLSLLWDFIDQLEGYLIPVRKNPANRTLFVTTVKDLDEEAITKSRDSGRRRDIRGNKETPEPTQPLAIMIGYPATPLSFCLCFPTSRSVTKLIGMRILELRSIIKVNNFLVDNLLSCDPFLYSCNIFVLFVFLLHL